MALPLVRAFPLYYNSRKIGEAHGVAFNVNGGRQKVFGAEGFLTLSKGAVTSGVDVQYIVPVAGMSVEIMADILNQNDVEIQVPAGGHLYGWTMGLTQGSFDSNTESGVAEGKCTLEGGQPKQLF